MPPKKIKGIKDWRLVFGGEAFDAFVEGHLEGDPSKRLWRTSKVKGIESSRIIISKTDTKYRLIGNIDRNACIDKRFPSHIVSAFTDGFPENWKELLSSVQKELTKKAAERSSTNVQDLSFDNDFVSLPRQQKKQTKAVVPYKSTPDTVYTTRSGRVAKPILASWANQSAVYDTHGNVVQVRNPTTITRVSKQVNQKLDVLCDSLDVDTPKPSAVQESSVKTPKRKSNGSNRKKNLVAYDASDSDDSIDAVSLDGIDTFDTPIAPSRQPKKLQQRMLKALESSPEEVENVIGKEKRKRGRQSKDNVIPVKKGKQSVPPSKGLKLKPIRENIILPSPSPEPVIEFPESETEIEIVKEKPAPKRWMQKEKDKLMDLLKAMNPITDKDWEGVARSKTDIPRTVEELKAKAEKEGWKARNMQGQRVTLGQNKTNDPLPPITAHPNSMSYLIQVQKQNQAIKKRRNEQNHTVASAIRSPINFNDSLLSSIRTPENPRKPRFAMNPTILADLDDTNPDLNASNSSLNSSTSTSFIVPDERSKTRQQICNLNILKKNTKPKKKPINSSSLLSDATNTTAFEKFLKPQLPNVRKPRYSDLAEEDDDDENEFDESQMDESIIEN